ncbi:MAG: ABC transporter ATP-binding protein [Lachnospiraceae bacterium]|nr:ABC transporter ATP-binding protein [Lachnospiraceae bacterium]
MSKENAIEVTSLKKTFKVYPDKSNSVKEKVLFWKRNKYEKKEVLKGISFEIKKGEAIGLIGKNGCGKSTTLKLLNRIMYPTSGKIKVEGKVSSLIELGAGFHPDMTGLENIYINASIFGLTKKDIDAKLDDIISFSELGDAIYTPVRTYSSGMYMRLAFSVAINVEADVLLIDEILAVGDVNFQKKCFKKLNEIKYSGATIVIVSHSLDQIEEICDRCIWIKDGLLEMTGKPKEVHGAYLKSMEEDRRRLSEDMKNAENSDVYDRESFCGRPVVRSGTGDVMFTDVNITDKDGKENTLFKTHDTIKVTYDILNPKNVKEAVVYVRLYRDDNAHAFGTTSVIEKEGLMKLEGRNKVVLTFKDIHLLDGNYMVDVDLKDENEVAYDCIHDTIRFDVYNTEGRTGMCMIDTDIETC